MIVKLLFFWEGLIELLTISGLVDELRTGEGKSNVYKIFIL